MASKERNELHLLRDGKKTHLIGVCIFPVGFEQMIHGHLIAFVIRPVTLTIQVQGVLVKATVIHDTKGHFHLHTVKFIPYINGLNCSTRKTSANYYSVPSYQCLAGLQTGAVEVANPLVTAIIIEATPQSTKSKQL